MEESFDDKMYRMHQEILMNEALSKINVREPRWSYHPAESIMERGMDIEEEHHIN